MLDCLCNIPHYLQDLPDVKLNRPTRHGLSHTQGDVYAKSRRAERDLKDKIQLMRFPVLDLLQPTRVEKRVCGSI